MLVVSRPPVAAATLSKHWREKPALRGQRESLVRSTISGGCILSKAQGWTGGVKGFPRDRRAKKWCWASEKLEARVNLSCTFIFYHLSRLQMWHQKSPRPHCFSGREWKQVKLRMETSLWGWVFCWVTDLMATPDTRLPPLLACF